MAKERSPNYPGFGLETAVQYVQQIYDKERRSAVPVDVAAKALGYASPSGPALTKIASLRQYGLVDKAGAGRLKVSDLALDFILHASGDSEYQKAARTAAMTPPLFQQLFKEYADGSNDAMNAHLVKTLKFSPEGSARVIKAYRDTVSFAKLVPGSYNDFEERTTDYEPQADFEEKSLPLTPPPIESPR